MFAVEQYTYAKTDEYITLFHRYISRSIEALSARLGPDVRVLSNEQREEAWHLLDYALKLAHGWQVARHLLLALAPRMERDGFRHEWLPYLQRGVLCCRQAHDRSGEARLCLYIGRIHRLLGDYATAHEWLARSADLAQAVGDHIARATALNQLAYVARLQSKYDLTQQSVETALSLLPADDPERAHSHWVLGTMATAQLDWAEAVEQHRKAWQIWEAAGDRQRAAWGLQNVGNALRGAGNYDAAIEHIQQAIVILGELGDPVNQAVARMNRGVAHIYAQDHAQARALFHLAEPVFRQVGDQLHLAMVHTDLLIVERELGNFELAVGHGLKAVRLAEVLNNLKMQANAMDELGLAYLALGRREQATSNFRAALQVIERAAPDPFQKMVKQSLLDHLADAEKAENR